MTDTWVAVAHMSRETEPRLSSSEYLASERVQPLKRVLETRIYWVVNGGILVFLEEFVGTNEETSGGIHISF